MTATTRIPILACIAVLGCALLGLGTLYYCLPEPKVRAYVIDATIEHCTPPARRNVERDDGVVLTLRVTRRSTIYEHRKPWDLGRVTAGEWLPVDDVELFYASDAGADCAAYLGRGRDIYTPFTDSPADRIEPATVWSPTDTTGFLSLMQLGPVPREYRQLLR